MFEPRLVGGPFAGHEYKSIKHHSLANDGNPAQRVFQNDEESTMHNIRIGEPPEIDPVRVYLVVGDQDQTLWELALQRAALREMQ